MLLRASPWLLVLLLSACAIQPAPETPRPVPPPAIAALTAYPLLKPVDWASVEGWHDDTVSASWDAFRLSCQALGTRAEWAATCKDAAALTSPDEASVRAFFEQHVQPYAATQEDGGAEGLITGYYEPRLKGDRVRTERARYPVYGVPDDLIVVDLASVYPELKNLRLRGRLAGNRLVPYATRRDIEMPNGKAVPAKPLAWVEDPVDLFFLQIQGSGRIELPDGSHLRVGYADQNGHPYVSIGKRLVESGELKLEEASMQGIKAWGARNPERLPELLAGNPSYVFFRVLPDGPGGPLGALGQPLTPGRSIAIDPRYVPLGAPVFLATTEPNSSVPMNRLVMAQDTGGAIRGGVRADFFWGFGDEAGERAGRMKQRGRLWVLLPKAPEVSTPPEPR